MNNFKKNKMAEGSQKETNHSVIDFSGRYINYIY